MRQVYTPPAHGRRAGGGNRQAVTTSHIEDKLDPSQARRSHRVTTISRAQHRAGQSKASMQLRDLRQANSDLRREPAFAATAVVRARASARTGVALSRPGCCGRGRSNGPTTSWCSGQRVRRTHQPSRAGDFVDLRGRQLSLESLRVRRIPVEYWTARGSPVQALRDADALRTRAPAITGRMRGRSAREGAAPVRCEPRVWRTELGSDRGNRR